ncbi:SH3 domain-binding protein 2 isoform X2 [Kryptolebias marmoratus]|uniref:SH3 domain-binding protein 2 isoform X2 n=1 Tax=Kryptolebias marmoratus TaxID=37003 RepID=UPI000D530B91|nr:SH3 domain-binding protein 2 isoform X2 [Kryptolebias marmoratus]
MRTVSSVVGGEGVVTLSAAALKASGQEVNRSKPLTHRSSTADAAIHGTMSSPEMSWPVPMRAIGAQNLLTMPGGVSTAGYLHKKGGSQFSLMKWPLRYIIIHKGCVYYFKSSTSPSPQGAFSLNGYNRVMRAAEETTSSNVFPFKIVHFSKKHRTWLFSAASEAERRKWMRHLRREIDHYNDRKEAQFSSDSDSDADSFYGTIERPMDIKHPVETADDDYVDEDDDEDEEDYLKPDSDPSGRPMGPPPSYPPPPVPAAVPSRQDTGSNFHKGQPPFILPQHRVPTSPLPKKPPSLPPPVAPHRDSSKGPPPPLPSAPYHPKSPSPTPPPVPSNLKKSLQSRCPGTERREWTSHSSVSPATLPICQNLDRRGVLNGPDPTPINSGTQSLGPNCGRCKPILPPPQAAKPGGSFLPVNHAASTPPSVPVKPPACPGFKPGPHTKLTVPKPGLQPSPPPVKSKPGTALQATPDGQSFRSLVDEKPVTNRRTSDQKRDGKDDDSDGDYETVQLPKSVFINSTETSFVEKLFRETEASPQDGLYGIRNSRTKTTRVLVVWDVSINKARNYRLFEEGDSVFLESDVTFPDLSALIEHYYLRPLPQHGSLRLQKPYTDASIS